jgi:hypothetical protein
MVSSFASLRSMSAILPSSSALSNPADSKISE